MKSSPLIGAFREEGFTTVQPMRTARGCNQNIDGRERGRETEAADENSGNRGEQFFRIPLRWKCLDTLFEPDGRSTSFALM